MFDIKYFEYDETTHSGTYMGKPVPSVTQLVDIMFPYSRDIPEERLQNAASRGTKIHGGIETLNAYFTIPIRFDKDLKEVIDAIKECENNEPLVDYACILSAYRLFPFDYEEMIFLLDENGELICYGHYDLVCMALKDYDPLFKEELLYLFDIKTTSEFNKEKVALQESIYALAYEQANKDLITNIFGLWLREGVKIVPLKRWNDKVVIDICKRLREVWNVRRETNQNCEE